MYEKVLKGLTETCRIIGRKRYFSSVVLVPFMFIENEWHIVFQKRAQNIRQGGEVSFPGGGYDPVLDKTFEDTALRETVEEMGIYPGDIRVDGHLGTLVAAMGAIVDVYVGRILLDGIDKFNINRNEVERVFTVPANEFVKMGFETYQVWLEINPRFKNSKGEDVEFSAKELGIPERYNGKWGGKSHDIYFYRIGNEVIWGLTAEILRDMLDLASE